MAIQLKRFIGIFCFVLSMSLSAQKTHLTAAQAKEEYQQVVSQILRYHPNPFHRTQKETFFKTVDSILGNKGDISIGRHYFNLSKICSLIYDTHVQFYITKDTPGFSRTYPLRFKRFSDGLYIIAGSKEYEHIIGEKVIRISGHDAIEVMDDLAQYAPSDNDLRKRIYAERFLYIPETYEVLDLLDNDVGGVELELEDLSGKRSKVLLDSYWDKRLNDFGWDMLSPFIPDDLIGLHTYLKKPVPFYLKHLDRNYWFTFLDDEEKYFYLQINRSSDIDGYHSLDFHSDWTSTVLKHSPEVIIIDLRNNPGGMTNIGSGIPKFLESYQYANYPHSKLKGVALLFGHDTVSAGTILAAEIENTVWPILIGEPSGSSPNMFLDKVQLTLPYSKFIHETSKRVFVSANPIDPRAYLAPDIPVSSSFADYLNGSDPALEAAKNIDGGTQDKVYDKATLEAIWLRDSQHNAIKKK